MVESRNNRRSESYCTVDQIFDRKRRRGFFFRAKLYWVGEVGVGSVPGLGLGLGLGLGSVVVWAGLVFMVSVS